MTQQHATRNTQHVTPIEFTLGQLSRLLGVRELALRKHLHKVDPTMSTRQADNHELVRWDTLVALQAQSTTGGRLAQKLTWLLNYFGDDPDP